MPPLQVKNILTDAHCLYHYTLVILMKIQLHQDSFLSLRIINICYEVKVF